VHGENSSKPSCNFLTGVMPKKSILLAIFISFKSFNFNRGWSFEEN
jgi:hypothetical protein